MIAKKNVIIFLFSVALFSSWAQAKNHDGIDVFIEMCRNDGDNPTLIRSLYVEAEIEDEFIDVGTSEMIKQKWRMKFLLAVKDTIHNKAKITRQQWDFKKNEWRAWTTRLRLSADASVGEKEINIYNHDDNPEVTIENLPMSIPTFNAWGRVRGFTAFAASIDLLRGRVDYANYDFPKENIALYKAKIVAGINESGNKQFEKTGTKKYDNGATADILESFYQGKVVERYWTDSSRGYICPLIQIFYTETGKLAFEYKSENFTFHKDSGLWYPANYAETAFDETGKIKRKTTYRIDASTLNINHAVSDDEFSLDVKEKAFVVDGRTQRPVVFRAIKKGTLSLSQDDLQLKNKTWLHAGEDMPPNFLESKELPPGMSSEEFEKILIERFKEKILIERFKKREEERVKKEQEEATMQRLKKSEKTVMSDGTKHSGI